MLGELLAGLKKNKEVVTVLMIGALLMSSNTNSILDRFAPKRIEVERGPASEPSSRQYVDTRIADLDKLSEQRHLATMAAINGLSASVTQVTSDVRTLGARVYELNGILRRKVTTLESCSDMVQKAVFSKGATAYETRLGPIALGLLLLAAYLSGCSSTQKLECFKKDGTIYCPAGQ